jgi:hypothetical protein
MSRRARAAAEAKYRWDLQLAGLDQVIATVVSQFHPVDSLLGMRPLDNDAAGESTETG